MLNGLIKNVEKLKIKYCPYCASENIEELTKEIVSTRVFICKSCHGCYELTVITMGTMGPKWQKHCDKCNEWFRVVNGEWETIYTDKDQNKK